MPQTPLKLPCGRLRCGSRSPLLVGVFVSATAFNTALTPAQQAAQPGAWSSHQTTYRRFSSSRVANIRGSDSPATASAASGQQDEKSADADEREAAGQ